MIREVRFADEFNRAFKRDVAPDIIDELARVLSGNE